MKERRNLPPQLDQSAVKCIKLTIWRFVPHLVIESRGNKRILGLGIGGGLLPVEGREFLFSPFSHEFNEIFVFMADEILKWSRLPVLFAHEQQRDERGKNDRCGCEFK